MTGILAIWNDCAPEGLGHFERWYIREHLQDRVAVPGFRFGRRYEAVDGSDRRFFAFYEVDSPDVLSSPAYLGRLEHPTPWTLQVMISLRRMARTVCDVHAAAGDLVAGLAREEGIARVQPWTAAARQTPADTAEIAAAARTS